MELNISDDQVKVELVLLEKATYTRELGIDMAAMIITSIDKDKTTIFLLKLASLWYLLRPLLIKLVLTVRRKYQFRPASTKR